MSFLNSHAAHSGIAASIVTAGAVGGGTAVADQARRKLKARKLKLEPKTKIAKGRRGHTKPQGKRPNYNMSRAEFAAANSGPKLTPEERRARWEAKGSPRQGSPRQKPIRLDREANAAWRTKRAEQVAAKTPVARRKFIQPSQLGSLGTKLTIAGGLAEWEHKRNQDRREGKNPVGGRAVDTGIGAAAGYSLTDSASIGGGWTTKRALQRHREKHWDKEKHGPLWEKHKKDLGFTQLGEYHQRDKIDARKPSAQFKIASKYPKGIPGWRGQRILAWKNHPAVGAAYLTAGALAGAAVVNRRADKAEQAGQSAFGVKHGSNHG